MKTTLTGIESERIEPLVLRDPRVRFALFRGTVDAPLLQTEAFVATKLDDQLNEVTQSALKLTEFVSRDGSTVTLNPLFFWHKQEFGDLQTWFRTKGLKFEDGVKFVADEYDDAVVDHETTCKAFKR